MRIIVDTNVVVSGLLWPGPPARVLDLFRERQATCVTSEALLQELIGVLQRPRLQRRLLAEFLSPSDAADRYREIVSLVEAIPGAIPAELRDVDDAIVIDCARAAAADLIVSGDGDLLALGAVDGIRIVSAVECLQLAAPRNG